MGKIVMPKNSALLEEVEAVLKIYYEAGGWLSNDEYKDKLKRIIGDDQYSSSYTKKSQITSYFGFTEWEDIGNVRSLRRITERGKSFYKNILLNNSEGIIEDLMTALEEVTFGRNNFGCPDSDSDVEPPVVFVRATLELGYLTYKEFAFLLWKLEDCGANYTDCLRAIKEIRKEKLFELDKEAQKYTDAKPIMVLIRWGLLAEGETVNGNKTIIIPPKNREKYATRMRNLKIYNIDKNVLEIKTEESREVLNHNFYGMHITRRNSAVEKGEISIGWSGLGDLSTVDTKEQLANLMDEKFPEKKPRSKAQDVSQVWTFKGDMSIGDYVVFSDGKQAHIGVIKSDYYYEVDEETRDIDYVNNRKVEWLKSIDRELLPKVFRSALASARSVFSLNAYKSIILELLDKEVLDYDEEDIEEEIEEVEPMEEQRPYIELNFKTNIECDYERNRIVFGAPGTGKSFQMEEDRKTVLATLGGGYERVTFHPDYTYSSFVGCYKPVSERGKIEYKYVPGPFMRVLVQALRSGLKDEVVKPYLLVIEEINRAKVAAVFGEVFQLLDRDENGTSDYEINASEDVKQYLSDELGGSLESFDKIRIPNNMFIWASMNSADQGVFPMDTAFKRRWSFEYKGIDENEDKVGGKIVLGQGEYELEVEWNDLRKAINDVLARTFKINEDKLMGPFFIGEEVFAFDKETGMIKNPEKFKKVFKSKVIMYLFEDAAKQHKHKLFSGCDATTYSAICNKFDEIGIDIFGADFRTTYFAK